MNNSTLIFSSIIDKQSQMAEELAADFSNPEDYLQSSKKDGVLARALGRKIISSQTNTQSEDWTFSREVSGKPLALFCGASSGVYISISHSANYIAVAITKAGAIGIDIEHHKDFQNIQPVSELAFGHLEQREVIQKGADRFYEIWTAREAFAKATGRGLEQAANRQDQFPLPLSRGKLCPNTFSEAQSENWYFGIDYPRTSLPCTIAVQVQDCKQRSLEWQQENFI
ncbi:4'-phosphopantetheinyl transferase superfamily protein [Microvirga sp. W0021]|uniref:4'-phosphopantetheinyl transferase superfamily protein n=1 Tax=Hohaiivirga grylli TaxID=3133970 RepID=A0ABV0BL24_9HYPH